MLDSTRARRYLKDFDLRTLFIEEMGWDQHRQELVVPVDDQTFRLHAIAHKRGLVAFRCAADAAGRIPPYPVRRKIETQVAKSVNQHLIIYADATETQQVWQWVKREAGRPTAAREQTFFRNQTGEALLQKLQAVTFGLEEEDQLTLVQVAGRVKSGFDVERVTKRFYERFKAEHAGFLKFLSGIPDEAMQRWYASVMLNRLMFIYFIQKKGFLAGDLNYLRTQLAASQAAAADRYYADFLCPLFFEGFACRPEARSPAIHRLLGAAPYLNGGIFERHQIETAHGRTIHIPDAAFARLFDFFDAYQWHLDERPLRADNEINPDVLGYIFEKYINQKQMGAYYTKEDITGYISQNTILPYLLDAARRDCRVAFQGEQAVWRLLAADPDRYIYPALRHGAALALPPEIADGLDTTRPDLLERRKAWNRPAPAEYALPTEIWREVVARRQRYEEVKAKLAAGEVHQGNDLITYNLDIRQFAQDVIAACEGPELLRALWKALETVTILDPTVGSGAFLFAALNVLEPLYEGCLERMQAFVDDYDAGRFKSLQPAQSLPAGAEPESPKRDFVAATSSPPDAGRLKSLQPAQSLPAEAHSQSAQADFAKVAATSSRQTTAKFSDFRKVLARVAQHPNRRYFILKSIVINNLYGVDIMEEAVEICKLRLFLKLVAQVARVEDIEPLPDIDFNIRAGNTLVGYATRAEVERALTSTATGQGKLMFAEEADALRRFEERAADVERLFGLFRQQQTELGGQVTAEDKAELRRRLDTLDDELNRALAREYGVDTAKPKAYKDWLTSHKPLHWFVEFYGIMRRGGFDVLIGNPPWKEYASTRTEYAVRGYGSVESGNLYGLCIERALTLRSLNGHTSFIVQLPLISSSRMSSVRGLLTKSSDQLLVIPFGDRPGKLFDGLEHSRSTIFLSRARSGHQTAAIATCRYQRWPTVARQHLFATVRYTVLRNQPAPGMVFPKYANEIHESVWEKVKERGTQAVRLSLNSRPTRWFIFYQEATEYWTKATVGLPFYAKNGIVGPPAHGRHLYFEAERPAHVVSAILNSSLFFTYFVAFGDCFHLSDTLVSTFPVAPHLLEDPTLVGLNQRLMNSLRENAERKRIATKDGDTIEYDEFYGWKSKSIIDEIDGVLAGYYGFTDEELDFIINYDIKYRMGDELETGDAVE